MNTENKRVVVYVANPTVLDITTFRLELLGITAIGVTSDEEMTSTMASVLPDVVLIDLDLADGKGLFWIEKIAAEECTSHIPIMCISDKGDPPTSRKCIQGGDARILGRALRPNRLASQAA